MRVGIVELLFLLLIIALLILFIVFVVKLPISIAKGRGVEGKELETIKILSWFGLLVGITWFIALILALVYQPTSWINKSKGQTNLNLEALEKLYNLKKKGVISDKEYKIEREKLLGKK